MNRQAKLVKEMTDKELLLNLYLSQAIFFFIAIVISFFHFENLDEIRSLFQFNVREILIVGGGVGVIVVLLDVIVYKIFPKDMLDDGGINERIFAKRSIFHIFIIALVVSFCEEILFRGVLQNMIGYVLANTIFAIIHFRYLSKPVLFFMVVGVSFLLGYLFLRTNNLFVPIFAHFIIDFILGVLIMIKTNSSDKKMMGI